jgi:glycosyltransferase involved in cell wall biosynthesis
LQDFGLIPAGICSVWTLVPISKPSISVVVPVYKSEASLPLLYDRLSKVLEKAASAWELILVNDASGPATERVLEALLSKPHVVLVTMAANVGQMAATFHGLMVSRHDVVVTMDDDLQTPPEELPKLVNKLAEGYELVIGRITDKQHSSGRNLGSALHQSLVSSILKKPKTLALSSYRAMTRTVADALLRHKGVNIYLPALLLRAAPMSKITNVDVEHHPRLHGQSTYTLRKLFSLASRLLINHSLLPLRAVVGLGLAMSVLSFAFAGYLCFRHFFGAASVPGWTSLMVVMCFLFGNLFIALGVMGEYIDRLVKETSWSRDVELFSIQHSEVGE